MPISPPIARCPRVTGLALSVDGTRLVAVVSQPDDQRAKYVSSLWQIPVDGGEAARLTRSVEGESAPAFRPDGMLLFISSRPDPAAAKSGHVSSHSSDPDEPKLWALPPSGEAYVLAERAGGLGGPVVAAADGAVLVTGRRLVGADPDRDDAARRTVQRERRVNAILHTGMPIRYWDHELGADSTRLLLASGGSGASEPVEPVELAPDAGWELENATYSLSADAATVATSWRQRAARGRRPDGVAVIDVAAGTRTLLDSRPGWELSGPVVSPDGRHVALVRERTATFDVAPAVELAIVGPAGEPHAEVALGDLWPTEWAWTPASDGLLVTGDLHGRGAVVLVDPDSGQVVRRLASDAGYSALCPEPSGAGLYALRSAMDAAPSPVRLDIAATDQTPRALRSPAPTPPLPGSLVELPAAGGAQIHGWLFLPPQSDQPAPLMLWVHGGPFASYNAWSWRWNPWVAVAHGWAVLLPDPALSTGYGPDCIDRAWPYRADVVWSELEGALDDVVARPEIDSSRVALLGGSFGGFMTNWIAGHTDRFTAIVTHAGLWALDQQHATTDAAEFKTGVFGTLADHPEWYARYSPHNTVDEIVTPMLVVHGNRDYRVPVSEALRLWWDLVSRWAGDPAQLPHRFLQFTAENHWVLSPANAEIWYHTVLGFCGEHVRGDAWTRSPLL